jgi:hypothetical protein
MWGRSTHEIAKRKMLKDGNVLLHNEELRTIDTASDILKKVKVEGYGELSKEKKKLSHNAYVESSKLAI